MYLTHSVPDSILNFDISQTIDFFPNLQYLNRAIMNESMLLIKPSCNVELNLKLCMASDMDYTNRDDKSLNSGFVTYEQ